MTRATASFSVLMALLLGVQGVYALDYVSVEAGSATLYEANSPNSRKLYVVSRYTPLERVINTDSWVKVRDREGSMAWVEKRVLSSKRFVVVTVAQATVRQAPKQDAEVAFQVAQNVALEWLAASGGGWTKVRHLDGSMGYVRATEVWGDE